MITHSVICYIQCDTSVDWHFHLQLAEHGGHHDVDHHQAARRD